jgi:nitrate reductase molybdenum cofactor assembly chaperone NarJ/NarW
MAENPTACLYELFADLLEYPTPKLSQQAKACAERLRGFNSDAAAWLEGFSRSVEELSLKRMEELYTSTFDMQPVCYPYVGYHLFGESYKRGAFMARLNKAYRACGYSAGDELPDHVVIILRYLALGVTGSECDFDQALLCEGLVPTLGKMAKAIGDQTGNPYAAVISALLLVLPDEMEKEMNNV